MCIVHRMDLESPAVFECAQAGCEHCVEALLRRHERLVHAIMRRQWCRPGAGGPHWAVASDHAL